MDLSGISVIEIPSAEDAINNWNKRANKSGL
jgi:hypothetical protein